jgi:hypothetical protein
MRNRCSTAVYLASASTIHLRKEVSRTHHSPLTTSDIQLLAKNREDTLFVAYGVTMHLEAAGSPEELDFQQRWCEDDFELEVRGKSLVSLRPMQTQNFLLGFDQFGLLVPKKFAPTPTKRRKISARGKPRTREDQAMDPGAEVAADDSKNKTVVKRRAQHQGGGNVGKRNLRAIVPQRHEEYVIEDGGIQLEDDSDDTGFSIDKHASQSSTPHSAPNEMIGSYPKLNHSERAASLKSRMARNLLSGIHPGAMVL